MRISSCVTQDGLFLGDVDYYWSLVEITEVDLDGSLSVRTMCYLNIGEESDPPSTPETSETTASDWKCLERIDDYSLPRSK